MTETCSNWDTENFGFEAPNSPLVLFQVLQSLQFFDSFVFFLNSKNIFKKLLYIYV